MYYANRQQAMWRPLLLVIVANLMLLTTTATIPRWLESCNVLLDSGRYYDVRSLSGS
jgi:hypothetical protein